MARKKLDIGILEIQKGGRGNTAKKNYRIQGGQKHRQSRLFRDGRVVLNTL